MANIEDVELMNDLTERIATVLPVVPEEIRVHYEPAIPDHAPQFYYSRCVTLPSEDGFGRFLIDSEDGWVSDLLQAKDEDELRAKVLAQLRIAGWVN